MKPSAESKGTLVGFHPPLATPIVEQGVEVRNRCKPPGGGTGGLGADRATVIERGDRLNEFLPQLHAYLAEVGKGEGLTIVVDNAATASLIGSGMIQSIEL